MVPVGHKCADEGLGGSRGDGLEWSPVNGHIHTAAPGSPRGCRPATGRCAAERRLVTIR